jgi:hypothetical protein
VEVIDNESWSDILIYDKEVQYRHRLV